MVIEQTDEEANPQLRTRGTELKDKAEQHDNDVIITITNASKEIADQANALRIQPERLLTKS